MTIAVILPAHNEASRIGAVLERMPAHIDGNPLEVVVVDDGSKDATYEIASSFKHVHLLRHRTNLGKGAAAKTGCDAAYQLGADILVLMDADGQHRPEDIARIIQPLCTNKDLKMVVGTREIDDRMPMTMRLGNVVLTAISRILFNIPLQDTQSGFRAFPREVYPKIRWGACNYAMETEMLILAAHNKVGFAEVIIDTIYLDNYKGTTVLDGLNILRTLLAWKLPWYRESKSLESSLVS